MAGDTERLVVSIEGRITNLEREMKKAQRVANDNFRGIEKRGQTAAKNLEKSFSNVGRNISKSLEGIGGNLGGSVSRLAMLRGGGGLGLAAGAGGALAVGAYVRAAQQAGDEWIKIGNLLKAAGISTKDLATQQALVADLSRDSRADLSATAALYTKMLGAAQAVGASQQDAATATRAFAQAISLGGVDAQSAAGAIRQLGQALQSGVLRGDEFNSIMEALGTQSPVVQAIAREFGVTAQKLRELAENGELVSSRVFRALVNAGPEIARQFGGSVVTVDQALTHLNTSTVQLLATFGQGTGITNLFAGAIDGLAKGLDYLEKAMRDASDGAARMNLEAAIAEPAKLRAEIAELEKKIASGELNGIDLNLYQERLKIEKSRLDVAEKAAEAAQKELDAAQKKAAISSTDGAAFRRSEIASMERLDAGLAKGRDVIASEANKAAMEETEAEIVKRADELAKAIEKAGGIVDRAAVRAQAEFEVSQERAKGGIDAVTSSYTDRVIRAESGGRANARNPNSSAMGLGQFIESTWIALFKKHFPQQAAGMGREAILALRADSAISRRLIEEYAKENAAVLDKAGLAVTEANLHLAHLLGPQGAVKVLQAAPGTALSSILPPGVISANKSLMEGKSREDLLGYADRRAGDTRQAAGDLTAQERRLSTLREILTAERQDTDAILMKAGVMGQSALQVAYHTERLELLNKAKAAGIDLTAEEVASLEREAMAHAQAAVGAQEHEDKLAAIGEAKQFVGQALTGFFSSIVTGSASAGEALKRLLDSLVDVILQAALMGEGPLGKFFGGGIFGAIFKGMGYSEGGAVKAASGGFITGPGTGTSDSIPAMLSNGEYVVRAAAVRGNERLLEAINSGKLPHFAAGGMVGSTASIGGSSRSSSSITIAPTINVEGGSKGEEADTAMAKKISREMENMVRGVVADETRRQMRQGGILNRR